MNTKISILMPAIIDFKFKENNTRATIQQTVFYTKELARHIKQSPEEKPYRQYIEQTLQNKYNALLICKPYVDEIPFLNSNYGEKFYKAKLTKKNIINKNK